jgi:hypothetical protein
MAPPEDPVSESHDRPPGGAPDRGPENGGRSPSASPTVPSGTNSSPKNSERTRTPPRRPSEPPVIGRLIEHGRANYQYRADQDASYYVRILTSRGQRTLWGKDLERALRAAETQPKVGDLVGARRVARQAVTVTARVRDADGRIIRQEEHHAHRTRWVVEKVKFFADRARLARQVRDEQTDVRESVRAHPELKSAFLSVRAAEAFAAQRIADPKDRERFLQLVRGAMAGSIQKGEPLPSVRLRERPKRSEPTPSKTFGRKPDEPAR